MSPFENIADRLNMKYDGLILTTIKLDLGCGKSRKDLKTGEKVTFTDSSGNADTEAAFLKDIKVVEVEHCLSKFRKKYHYTAKYVSEGDAAAIAREGYGDKDQDDKPAHTTLFSVHGAGGDPASLLLLSLLGRELFSISKRYYLIPVIWPTEGPKSSPFSFFTALRLLPNLFTVFFDRWNNKKSEQKLFENLGDRGSAQLLGYPDDWEKFAPKGGKILRDLADNMKNGSFGEVSLMCHSMGNHLVFNNASDLVVDDKNKGVKFQDIFLVGADIKNDSFSKNPSPNSLKTEEEIKDQALGMKTMLAEKGKIYVLHTEKDLLLEGSPYAFNSRPKQPRLGFTGAIDIGGDEADDKEITFSAIVRNIDVTKNVDRFTFDSLAKHGYVYDPWAMAFYNDVHAHRENEDYIPEKYMSQVATCKTN